MESGKLTGIVNGIDTDLYNPETDPLLDYHFSKSDLTGKARNKAKLQEKVGKTFTVLVDEIDVEENIAICRSYADAPEIDGVVYVDNLSEMAVKVGDVISVKIHQADEYDLWGTC